jgi:Helix-turn-helix domain
MAVTATKRIELTPQEVADRMGVHVTTTWRWIVEGTTGYDGSCIRLRARRIGGRFLVEQEAIKEFERACIDAFSRRVS